MPARKRESLRDIAPQLFDEQIESWNPNEWRIEPITSPESLELSGFEADLFGGLDTVGNVDDGFEFDVEALEGQFNQGEHLPVPLLGAPWRPGMPWLIAREPRTPDAFAFYLPFHRYPERVWGIYITPDGVLYFAHQIERFNPAIPLRTRRGVARLYLYYHEFFHHIVESFATRLEVDRRIRLYLDPFQRLYEHQVSAGDIDEEALANGYALRRIRQLLNDRKVVDRKQIMAALVHIVARQTYGYQRGASLLSDAKFTAARSDFAEKNRRLYDASSPRSSAIWDAADNMFRGLENMKTQVCYAIPIGGPLWSRVRVWPNAVV